MALMCFVFVLRIGKLLPISIGVSNNNNKHEKKKK